MLHHPLRNKISRYKNTTTKIKNSSKTSFSRFRDCHCNVRRKIKIRVKNLHPNQMFRLEHLPCVYRKDQNFLSPWNWQFLVRTRPDMKNQSTISNQNPEKVNLKNFLF